MARVVLVHGAWHGAWCWDAVGRELDRLGVDHDAIDLPLTGLVDDIACARDAIIEAGPGSVVVAHSYGGAVITDAASGIDGLRRLVYVAAFMTDVDEDQAAILNGHGSAILQCLERVDGGTRIRLDRVHDLLYGDSDIATAAAVAARLRPMRAGPPGERVDPAWKTVPSTYVVCAADKAVPATAQREMAARATEVIEWPTDHSPFLTRPGEVARLVASYL